MQLAAAAACLVLVATRRLPRLPLVLVLFPSAALLAVAAAGVPALYPSRAEALYLAPAMALLAAGAVRWRRVLAAALAAAGALTIAAALAAWPGVPPSPMERTVTAALDRLPEGGTLVTGGYWWLPAWYLTRSRPDVRLVCFPAELRDHPGWYDSSAEAPAPGEAGRLGESLLAGARAGRDVVVLVPDDPVAGAGLERLGRTLVAAARGAPGRVELLTLGPARTEPPT